MIMKKYFILLLSLCFMIPLQAEETQPSGAPVVVGIHGFLGNKKSYKSISRSFAYEGFKMYSFEYNSFQGNLRSHGHDLAVYLCCVAQQNPGQEINFVTQSLGAIILRAALNDPACPEEAKKGRAVMIAPPNQGTELARTFDEVGEAYRCLGFELAYELTNYTYEDIRAIGYFPEEMEILIIAGSKGSSFWTNETNDGLITISETAIDHTFYFQTYPVSHTRILAYTPAIRLAQRFICSGFDECEEKKEEAKTTCPCPENE
jgi:hypothetical protein